MTVKNSLPVDKKEKVLVATLNGSFFHEKTESGFVQVNRIEGNSVQNGTPTPDNPIEVKSFDSEIVTSGRNLWDLTKIRAPLATLTPIANGVNFNGTYGLEYNIFIPSGWAFRLTWKKSKETLYNHCDVFFDNGTTGQANNGAGYGISGRNVTKINLAITNGTTKENVNITDIILEITKFGDEFPFDYYEPFHATKTKKLTLRSLPNGVKDTLERQNDGSYLLTQRCKEFVLDGSEKWSAKRSDSPAERSVFAWNNDLGVICYFKSNNDDKQLIEVSSHYSSIGYGTWSDTTHEGIGGWTRTNEGPIEDLVTIMINLMTARLSSDDTNGLKAWLKANPVTCVMELITPIQRKVWLSPLSAYEGMTNIFANSEVGAEMEVEVLTTNAVNGKLHELKENILQEIPNPNLLVNSDFRNPINTTGKKEWGGNGSTLALDGMRILDGWVSRNKMTKTLLINGCLRIQNGSVEATGGRGINQILDKQTIKGRKMTLSFMVKNISNTKYRISLRGNESSIYSNSKIITSPSDISVDKPGLYTFTFNVFDELPYPYIVFGLYTDHNMHENPLGSYIDIEWVKLEIGDKATPLPYEDSKLNQLKTGGVPLLYGGEEITQNADLNNYVGIGNYYCANDEAAKKLKNIPTNLKLAFTMITKVGLGRIFEESPSSNYFMQKIETRTGQEFKREIVVPSVGDTYYGDWVETDSNVVGSEVPKLKFLAQPQLLKSQQGTYEENVTMTVNGGKGIFAFKTYSCQIVGMNGKTGSVFKFLDVYGFKASTKMFETNSSSPTGILFVDGINKPVAFFPYDSIFTFFDGGSVTSLDSIVAYASSSGGHVSVYKIAEFL